MLITSTPNVENSAIAKYLGIVRAKAPTSDEAEAILAETAAVKGANAIVCYWEQYFSKTVHVYGTAVIIEQR